MRSSSRSHRASHPSFGTCIRCPSSASPAFPPALRRYAEHQGATKLYHETITWAFLFLIQERRQQLPADHGWEDFARANPELLQDHKGTLARYYSKERLGSDLARSVFLMPDRCPLPAAGTEATP